MRLFGPQKEIAGTSSADFFDSERKSILEESLNSLGHRYTQLPARDIWA